MKLAVFLSLLFITYTSYSQDSIPTNGLTAEYVFDDGTGNSTIGGSPAVLSDVVQPTEDRFGNIDKAMYLDGTTKSSISIADNGMKPINGTISIWVRVDEISVEGNGTAYNPIITAKGTAQKSSFEGYGLYIDMEKKTLGGRVGGSGGGQSVTIEEEKPITLGTWQHVVLSYEHNSMKVYRNGIDISPVETSIGFPLSFSPEPIGVGNTLYDLFNRALKGAVDDIRVYNRVLSQLEVTSLYNAPNPIVLPPLVPIDNGQTSCGGKWVVSNPNNSSIVIDPNGTMKKISYSGNNKVESEDELPAGEKGWMKFKVRNFGIKSNDKGGRVKVGAEIDGVSYQFNIAENKSKHWIVIDGTPTETFEASFEAGAVIKIRRTATRLILKQRVDGQMTTVARIKNLPETATRFFIKLNGLGGTITRPKMSATMGCPPYATLKQVLDGGYAQLEDDILRIKFDQEYAVDPSTQYEDIDYNIYDWQRAVVQTGQIRVIKGTNWKNIVLNTLSPTTHYTLEFKANKEESYLLRFKTK